MPRKNQDHKSPVVCRTVSALRRTVAALRRGGKTVALVPTMGALHGAHARLMRRARGLADVVVVSIFVNPVQFGPNEDFARYPRPVRSDLDLCAREGVDVVFLPSARQMYPEGFSTYVSEEVLSVGLCGRIRPGHFRGVGTVVLKLFNLVGPDAAVFGRKDFQQLQVIRKMVSDLNLPVRVVAAPTVREKDGLAVSSRNRYLSPAERREAARIHGALEWARDRVRAGETRARLLQSGVEKRLRAVPGLRRIDYVAVVDARTLGEQTRVRRPAVMALAAWLGRTRLIDNIDL